MSIFLLMRHGESEAQGYIAGRSENIHLSTKGRNEADELAEVLSHLKLFSSGQLDLFFSSPLTRTYETAEIISHRLKKEFTTNETFLEVDFGNWTGKRFSELRGNSDWERFNSFRTGTIIPGGETMAAVQLRMVTEIERLRKEFPDKVIGIVSHGDPIRSVICYYTGIPLDFMTRVTISTASLSIIEINDNGPVIQCINHTAGVRF
jgi:probable phosphoglycerate mutase